MQGLLGGLDMVTGVKVAPLIPIYRGVQLTLGRSVTFELPEALQIERWLVYGLQITSQDVLKGEHSGQKHSLVSINVSPCKARA